MQEAVNRFCGCLSRIEARRQSGKSIQDKLIEAQSLYKVEDPKNNGFPFMHCWNMLKHEQKWIVKERELAAPKGTNKRQKAHAESSTPSANDMITPTSNPNSISPGSSQEENIAIAEYNKEGRPPGLKRTKKELKEARDNRFTATVDKLWEKKKVVDEERFTKLCQLEKERVQNEMQIREREVIAREKKAAAREKEVEAKCKEDEAKSKEAKRLLMLEEERIMNIDLSTLRVRVHDYCTRLQRIL